MERASSTPSSEGRSKPELSSPAKGLFGFAVLCLVWALYLYLWIETPANTVSPFIYGLLATVAAIAFGVARTGSRSIQINVLIATFSILFSLFGAEWTLSILDRRNPSPRSKIDQALIDSLEQPFDRRSQIEVIDDYRSEGIDAWPAYFPGYVQEPIYPLSGIAKVTTVYANENGTFMSYKSDEFGFNNPSNSHQVGLDIAFIGDSFTHGCCVSEGMDVASRLRSSNLRTVNLGMGESGPLEEWAILREFGLPLKPKTVFWLYYEENDLADLQREMTSPLLSRYRDVHFTQQLRLKQALVDDTIKAYVSDILLARRMAVAAMRNRQDKTSSKKTTKTPLSESLRPRDPWGEVLTQRLLLRSLSHRLRVLAHRRKPDPMLSEFVTILENAKTAVANEGGELIFVYLPEWSRFAYNQQANLRFRRKGEVLHKVRSLSIPTLDFTTILSNQENPLEYFPFEKYGHYTQEGYGLLAEQIERFLKKSDSSEKKLSL